MVQGKLGRAARQAQLAATTSVTSSAPHFGFVPARRPARGPTGQGFIRTVGSTAIALALAGAAAPVWAAACTPSDTSGCGAPGGDGFPGRSGAGGAGNGQGGGSSHLDASTVTVQDPGSWGALGTGGAGATGDVAAATANGPAQVIASSNIVINAPVTGDAGNTGPDGTNFGSGGNGGNTGLYYLGSNITVAGAAAVTGGAGGNGGNTTNGVSGNGGGGGGGGSGLTSAGVAATITNNGTITGGVGGTGGSGGFSGGGGAGGDGLLSLGGSASIVNTGTITGGAGGAAGAGASGSAAGGAGGTGVDLAQTHNSLANIGTISGGMGIGGGVGVVTRGMDSITNAGLIMGALTGAGGTRAAAIEFGGTDNSLNLLTGSSILGTLLFDAGATATIAASNTGLTLNNDVILSDAASRATVSTASTGLTMSGVISGAGSLSVVGGNTLTISGINTYTGATTISNGTLALAGSGSIAASSGVVLNSVLDISAVTSGTSIKALSGAGTVRLGAQSLSLTNAAGTFDGVIDGTGGVRVAAGTQTLTGTSTYTGATVVDSGATLKLSGGGSVAASSGVTSNGALDISATTNGASLTGIAGSGSVALGARTLTLTNASGVFSGSIGGSGGLTLNGGTQTLSAANVYTGATTINGGTLALTGAGQLSSVTSLAMLGSGATFDMSAAGTQAVSGLSGVAGTRLLMGANSLSVDTSGNSTYAGDLAGSGTFTKLGSGMLVLNGASTAFTGTTSVAAGTLEVGDANHDTASLGGDVAVGAQGTLRGHGTIIGSVTNGGIVAPGGSIGTLRISGNYTQASNATLAIEVSPTAASQLKVSGSATLNGVLAITYDPGTYQATRYTVVTAANGVNGRFSSVTGAQAAGANLGSLQSSVAYGANDVILSLVDPSVSDPGSSGAIVIAPKNTSVYTALGTAALANAQSTAAALLDQATRRAVDTGLATGDAAPRTSPVWATATGLHARVNGSGAQSGFQENQYGFLAGAERHEERVMFGLAGGYSHADLSEKGTASSGTRDTLRLAAYASREMGAVDVAATVGYGLHFLSQKRPFAGIGTAEGDHIGQELTAAAQASAPMAIAGIVVTPRAGLRYAYFHANGFDESGAGGQNLRVGTDNTRSLQPFVGVTLDKAFGDATRPVNVQFRVAYAHELLDVARVITVASQDGTAFVASGADLPRGFLTLGASVGVTLAKHLDISLAYDALVNTARASSQAGSLKVSYRF